MSKMRSFLVEIYPSKGPMITVTIEARDYAHAKQVAQATYSGSRIGSIREER